MQDTTEISQPDGEGLPSSSDVSVSLGRSTRRHGRRVLLRRSISPRTFRSQSRGLIAVMLVVSVGGAGLWGIGLSAPAGASVLEGSPTRLIVSTSGVADVALVAKTIDPAIVDINTTLAEGEGTAAGTGMVITSDGDILTNNHVVEDAVSIKVTIPGRGTYSATVVGTDVKEDIAVLKVSGVSNLTTVRFDTSSVAVGTSVVAIGNALGKGGTPAVVSGDITALDKTVSAQTDTSGVETLEGLIETNAAIEPGDSGGPLLDAEGEVLGMDTAADESGESVATIAYSIPVSEIIPVVERMLKGEDGDGIRIGKTAFLGVAVLDSSSVEGPGFSFGNSTSRSGSSGVVVDQVVSGSPAAKAGIVAGDVITKLNGTSVTSESQLKELIIEHRVGDVIRVTYTDGSTSTTVNVKLVSGPVA
jgi:S1-C subfamily serine protease